MKRFYLSVFAFGLVNCFAFDAVERKADSMDLMEGDTFSIDLGLALGCGAGAKVEVENFEVLPTWVTLVGQSLVGQVESDSAPVSVLYHCQEGSGLLQLNVNVGSCLP